MAKKNETKAPSAPPQTQNPTPKAKATAGKSFQPTSVDGIEAIECKGGMVVRAGGAMCFVPNVSMGNLFK